MMTKDGIERIATPDGVILIDLQRMTELAGSELEPTAQMLERLFQPEYWSSRGELAAATGGRGAAWYVSTNGRWVLRHARRGGFIARLSQDRYGWAGEARVRTFSELRLLAELTSRGLPVPAPVAARYARRGMLYRCDLITARIAGAQALSQRLARAPLEERGWRDVGAAIARLHQAGADHADLNAHNILLDAATTVSIVDFDRGRLRAPSTSREPARWAARNLSRLQRSLRKIVRGLPADRFGATQWQWLRAGYADFASCIDG